METPMWGGAITRQQLLQSICLFQTLNEVPESPKDNFLPADNNPGYCLSLLREKEITSNLAFLSSISDNRLRVTAVCIEEHDNKEELTIRIASNTGDLTMVTDGFEKMAQVLERAARRATPQENPEREDVEALLERIVELDFYRILARLRSKHARKSSKGAGKPPIITQLSAALQESECTARMTDPGRERLRTLQELFVQLENLPHLDGTISQAQELLSEIVKGARELTLTIDLKAVLENSAIEPSLKERLIEGIRKVGKYYAAASDLISAAKHKTGRIFSKIHVELFQIKVPDDIKAMKGEIQLSNLPDPVAHSSKLQVEKMEDNLRKRIAEVSMHLKVHAEIQLLFFYELNPNTPRPRFICSSKQACYLCDLFLRIHGSFNCPRSHGRLYNMWILPDWLDIPIQRHQDFADMTKRLKDALDDRIKETLTSGPKRHLDPDESNVPSEAHYSSTAHSALELGSQASRSALRPQLPLSQEGIVGTGTFQNTDLPVTQPKLPQVPRRKSGAIDISPDKMRAHDTIKLAHQKIEAPSSTTLTSLVTVRQKNLPYSKLITMATPSLFVRLDRLSITLEFAEAISSRISIAQTEEEKSSERVRVVDIKDIPTTSELAVHCLPGSNEVQVLLQSRGKAVIHIRFVWDDAH